MSATDRSWENCKTRAETNMREDAKWSLLGVCTLLREQMRSVAKGKEREERRLPSREGPGPG